MATDKVQTGVRFNPIMLLKITHIARDNHRSFNAQMEHLAHECIKKYERENGEIQLEDEHKYSR